MVLLGFALDKMLFWASAIINLERIRKDISWENDSWEDVSWEDISWEDVFLEDIS